MPAEILSLDLDWFNTANHDDLKSEVRHFFSSLKRVCKLPRSLDFVPEHQYLYPWSVRLLDQTGCSKTNVVNIDEHHDFYSLDQIEFDDDYEDVGCWNFFAFMAHKKIMGHYVWVTNEDSAEGTQYKRECLIEDIQKSNSLTVKKFMPNIKVVNSRKVFDILDGRKFDGFMIIRSPVYTSNYRAVYHAVENALAKELPRTHVRRYKCRENFKEGRVHHRAKSLFWRI